jgi:hypothetical protein
MSAASVPAALTVLLVDREHPAAARGVVSWLGEGPAQKLMAAYAERFVMIATCETHSTPKYFHFVEFLRDADGLLAWLGVHLDSVSLMASSIAPAPVDFRFLLNPTDRARVDSMLDDREVEQLRRAPVAGQA